jgi:eukaryotic-like serine/threonine-protein kinase
VASPANLRSVLRFGAFELDSASGELRKGGIAVKIGPQPFRVLLLLAEHPRQVVTRLEIQRCLWGDDTFVDYERGINFCINQIRVALGDSAGNPRYIETLPRRGYRFVASVSSATPVEPILSGAALEVPSLPRRDEGERSKAAISLPNLLVVPRPRKRDQGIKFALIGTLSLAGVAFALYWFGPHASPPGREPAATQITANSADNPVVNSAISPDGKYLAFADKTSRMHLRLLATGETQTIPGPDSLKNSSVDWTIVRWFPDSTRFLANVSSPASFARIFDRLRFGVTFHLFGLGSTPEARSVWIVSVLGGPPQKLRDDAEAFSVSPDGSQIAFGTKHDQVGDHEIWLMDPKGQQARKLFDTPAGAAMAGFNWSADGQRAVYFRFDGSKGEVLSRDLKAGVPTTLLSLANETLLTDFVSLPDGRLIYAQSNNALDRSCNLWELRVDARNGKPVDKPRQLTNWSGFCAGGMSVTSDGKRLAFQRTERQTTVHIADIGADGTPISFAHHLTLNEYVNAAETWTPDGKALIFRSLRNGHLKLFKQNLDSDAEEPLVLGAADIAGSAISPDGASLYYLACGPTTDECGDDPVPLMQIPIDGGTPHTVLTSDTYGRPRCAVAPARVCVVASQSDDGKLLTFTAFDARGRGPELAKFETEPIAQYAWSLSGDGTRIAILKGWGNQIHILPLNSAARREITVKGESHLAGIYWAADGKGWFVERMSPSGVVLLHVDLQGDAQPVWESRGDTIAYGMPSPDGRHLAIVATVRSSNVWLLENF